jgi:uncharacterized protein (DUF2141 family)
LAGLIAVDAGAAEPVVVAPEMATLEVTISGIKSAKGVIRVAICPQGAGFPDCGSRAVRTATLTIENGRASRTFADLPAGTYAISVFHDANSNNKLDTFMGIPKEGYGFSRNPPFRPRAPRFDETGVAVHGAASAAISMRYIL